MSRLPFGSMTVSSRSPYLHGVKIESLSSDIMPLHLVLWIGLDEDSASRGSEP